MIALLWLALSTAFGACPDYREAIAEAERAVDERDYSRLDEALTQAQRGLACGPILENRRLRASFWLSQAVSLDAGGDRTSDLALVAAWRADPDVDIRRLPEHLQRRYAKLIRRPSEEARFRLHPAPDPNAVIYVDGQPFQQRPVDDALAHDASILIQAGMHIIQLAESPIALEAAAARVRDVPAGATAEFDIYEEALLGREINPLQIGSDFGRASGGCAGRR